MLGFMPIGLNLVQGGEAMVDVTTVVQIITALLALLAVVASMIALSKK
jgi:hypothetical protein